MNHNVFIALEPKGKSDIDLRTLTPRVMKWQDTLWLMDLRPVITYWNKRATRQSQSLPIFFQNMLNQLFPEGYQAGYSHHPLQALLIAHLLKEKNLSGLMDGLSPFGSSFYQKLSWSCFWSIAEQSVPHFLASGIKKSSLKQFSKNRQMMERAVHRLSLHKPSELSHTHFSSIHRRFGPLLTLLWSWVFAPEGGQDHTFDDFPFITHIYVEPPQISRTLDFPLLRWENIEPLLIQDLNKLCFHQSYHKGDLVSCLEWHMVMEDLNTLTVSIPFRHPHNLCSEIPTQQTATQQAYYHFMDISHRFSRHYEESELSLPNIVSWQLRITGFMPKRHKITDLFQEELLGQDELERLENLLAVSLTEYRNVEDWCAADAFSTHHQESLPEHAKPSLKALNAARPLFIYKEPTALKYRGSSLKRFLERTMDKWWDHQANNHQRDYYLMTNEQKQHLWIYQDKQGLWYTHGIFA